MMIFKILFIFNDFIECRILKSKNSLSKSLIYTWDFPTLLIIKKIIIIFEFWLPCALTKLHVWIWFLKQIVYGLRNNLNTINKCLISVTKKIKINHCEIYFLSKRTEKFTFSYCLTDHGMFLLIFYIHSIFISRSSFL